MKTTKSRNRQPKMNLKSFTIIPKSLSITHQPAAAPCLPRTKTMKILSKREMMTPLEYQTESHSLLHDTLQ